MTRRTISRSIGLLALALAGAGVAVTGHDVVRASRHAAAPSPPSRPCASAIYTTSVPRGSAPRATNAITVGAAIFNDLRGARRSLDRPSVRVPYYTYKSPLTVWRASFVTVIVSSQGDYARLIYTPRLINRLGARNPPRWNDLPFATRFAVCAGADGSRLATQYNGGFALRHPGCVAITVRSRDSAMAMRTVPFGRSRCRSSK